MENILNSRISTNYYLHRVNEQYEDSKISDYDESLDLEIEDSALTTAINMIDNDQKVNPSVLLEKNRNAFLSSKVVYNCLFRSILIFFWVVLFQQAKVHL